MATGILFAVFAGILLFAGLIGTILPVIPGPPLAWCGILLAFFSSVSKISVPVLVITGIVAVFVTVADNIFPSFFTKKNGGSKSAVVGSTIGLIAGFFLGPLGIVIGPFVGAYIGELVHDFSDKRKAFDAAWGAFQGFLAGTGLKLITVSIFIWIFIRSLF